MFNNPTKISSNILEKNSLNTNNISDLSITGGKIISNTIGLEKIIDASTFEVIEVGTIIWFSKNEPPKGYLYADGSVVKRTSYQQLFNVIGTSYNTGNEANDEFRLPDLRGQFIRGWNNGGALNIEKIRNIGSMQDQNWFSYFIHSNYTGTYDYTHDDAYLGRNLTIDSWEPYRWTTLTGKLFGGLWRGTGSALGTKWDTSDIHPENVALLPCIKAVKQNHITPQYLYDTNDFITSTLNKKGGVINGDLSITGDLTSLNIGAKSGPTSYIGPYRSRWNKGWNKGNLIDATSNTDGIIVRKAGYYEIKAWQRSGVVTNYNSYIAIGVNGNRSHIESREDGLFQHSHGGNASANFTWSYYSGYLEEGSFVTSGAPDNNTVSGSVGLSYGALGAFGGMVVKPLNSN